MRRALVFYTILQGKKGYPVKYVDPETYRVKRFCGPFGDPGEASQEFQLAFGNAQQCCYLDTQQFEGKARAMGQLRREKKRSEAYGG